MEFGVLCRINLSKLRWSGGCNEDHQFMKHFGMEGLTNCEFEMGMERVFPSRGWGVELNFDLPHYHPSLYVGYLTYCSRSTFSLFIKGSPDASQFTPIG